MSNMSSLRKLDYSFMASNPSIGAEYVVSTIAIDGSYAYVYTPTSGPKEDWILVLNSV